MPASPDQHFIWVKGLSGLSGLHQLHQFASSRSINRHRLNTRLQSIRPSSPPLSLPSTRPSTNRAQEHPPTPCSSDSQASRRPLPFRHPGFYSPASRPPPLQPTTASVGIRQAGSSCSQGKAVSYLETPKYQCPRPAEHPLLPRTQQQPQRRSRASSRPEEASVPPVRNPDHPAARREARRARSRRERRTDQHVYPSASPDRAHPGPD